MLGLHRAALSSATPCRLAGASLILDLPHSSTRPASSFKLHAASCKSEAASRELRAPTIQHRVSSIEHPASSIRHPASPRLRRRGPASAIQKSAPVGCRPRRRLGCRLGPGSRRDLPRRDQFRRVGPLGYHLPPGDIDDDRDHHDQHRCERRRCRCDDQPDDQAPHIAGLARIAHRLIPLRLRTWFNSIVLHLPPPVNCHRLRE